MEYLSWLLLKFTYRIAPKLTIAEKHLNELKDSSGRTYFFSKSKFHFVFLIYFLTLEFVFVKDVTQLKKILDLLPVNR